MYCRNCGIDIEDNMKFCPKCGIRVVIDKSSQEKPSQEKSYYYVSAQSRTTAMLLCSLGFIGFAGFHRFYVGNWRSGVVYFLSSGLFFLGTFYDLYQLYNGAFKDMDGYPLFSSAMMKENYRYRELTFPNHYKTMLLCMSLFFILNIFNTIIHLRNTQQQNAQQPKVQQQEETSHHDATSIPNDSIKKNIMQTVYMPKPEDHDVGPWYARIENTSNQRFKGRIKISNSSIADGAKNSWINLDLEPRESRFIAGYLPVPADRKVTSTIEGRFLDKIYAKDASLDYHIIDSHLMGDGRLTHYEMYVYMPPNVPDQTYIKIAEEVNRNYGQSYALTTVRFVDVGINPDINDTKIIFSRNNILKHCRILFYTSDETNTKLLPDGAPERKIINIAK
jgi:hypothetical protein